MSNMIGQLLGPINKIRSGLPPIAPAQRRALTRNLLIAALTVGLGIVVASLIVNGQWYLAAAILFGVPALLVLQRYPFMGVLAWLCAAPFLMHTSSESLRQMYWVVHRFMPPLVLILILLPAAVGRNQYRLPRLGLPEWLMAGYAAITLVSILFTNDKPLASTYLFYDRVIVPMFLYLIVRLTAPDKKLIYWLVPVFVFIALSQNVIGIMSYFAPKALPAKWVDYENSRTIGTLVNTNSFVTTIILAGLVFLHFGIQSDSKRLRTFSILVFLLTAYGIFITFSRAAWLAGILALLGLTVLYPKLVLRLSLTVVPLFLLVAGLFLQDQIRWANERLLSEQAENSALSRVPTYAAGLRMFAAKPFSGWGYQNFDVYDLRFQTPAVANIAGDNKDHASHNFFLTLLAEQGLTGILLFLGPMLYWLVSTIRHFLQLPQNGFWSRKLLVIFWMVLLSHIIVYNFANMRVVFTLGCWWLTLGLVARFIDSYRHQFVQEASPLLAASAKQTPITEAGMRS